MIPFIWYDMVPSFGCLAGCVNPSCSLLDNSLPFLTNCIARLIYWCPEDWNLKSWCACVQMFKLAFSTIPADKSICWGHTSGDSKWKIFWWLYSYWRTSNLCRASFEHVVFDKCIFAKGSNLAKVHTFAINNVCQCSWLKLIGLAKYTILSGLS